MAYAKKTSYSSSRPSQGGAAPKYSGSKASGHGKAKSDRKETNCYVKSGADYVSSIFAYAETNDYGPYFKLDVTEAVQPGRYILSAKKGVEVDFVNVAKEGDSKTTHNLKNLSTKEFVAGAFLWANEGKFGTPYISLSINEVMQPGSYVINANRRDS